jgi:crotonobetainyl-CoA:carnitine CoA-transferase CaiB-like acyl-CoA transferase
MGEPARILDGIKVLEVGTWVFGPAAATVMSDFGADVVKIENPAGGDPYRKLYGLAPLPKCDLNYCWLLDGRNKKSVALDLKNEEARPVLDQLVREADVFVTNYPPAVAAALRITYEEIAPLNARLIYAYATGYGEAGSEVDRHGYDATVWWARSGLMDVVRAKGAEPAFSVPGMGDHPSAMTLFGGIMLALYQRERTGRGTKVSSSLLANGAWANGCYVQAALCGSEPYQHTTRVDPPNALANPYRTRDDRWIFPVLMHEGREWPRLAEAIERPDLPEDPRFNRWAARRKHAKELVAILDEVFAGKELDDWCEILDKHRVTFGVISRLEDLPNDPQMLDNDIFVEVEDPRVGRFRTVNSPIWIEGQSKVKPRLAPEIGEHTEHVLTSLGYDADAIQALRDRGAIP